jgi:suppressor of G2 allele of SKP1
MPEKEQKLKKKVSKIKHDWYQTESHVIITILAKNTKEENVNVEFGGEDLSVSAKLSDGSNYELKLNLTYPVISDQSTVKITAS